MDNIKNETNSALISVIVPVYNVRLYLEKCVLSIINQTYKNLEILLINDGSTDDSGELAENIAQKDGRITVFHKQNGGVSSARNLGIEKAKGEYLIFVDADDYLAEDFVENMLEMAIKTNAEFCLSKNCFTKKNEMQVEEQTLDIITPEEATALLLAPVVVVGCWNKIFKRTFIEKNNLRFSEDLFYGEGLRFITTAAQLSNCVAVSNYKAYYYRKNNESSATTKFNIEKMYNGEKSIDEIEKHLLISSKKIETMLCLHRATFSLGAAVKLLQNKQKSVYLTDYKRWMSCVRKSAFLLLFKRIPLYRKALLLGGGFFPYLVSKMDKIRKQKNAKNSVGEI